MGLEMSLLQLKERYRIATASKDARKMISNIPSHTYTNTETLTLSLGKVVEISELVSATLVE